MLALLKKLISFPTDKDHPEEQKKCLEFTAGYLKKSGLKVKIHTSNNQSSLIAGRKLKKSYQYLLSGHLDVVPASYPNAFKPLIKGKRLYGRGASDMKSGCAVMIKLMQDKKLLKTDMALMLTTDEEVGGLNGTAYLVNKQGYRAKCVLLPDGGDNFHLTIGEKAVLHLKITAKGKSAHGSRPWLGNNAIEKLIKVYQFLKTKIPDTEEKNRWKPTVNLGKLAGGDAPNKVPNQAEMYLDFRYPYKWDKEKIFLFVKQAVNLCSLIRYEILAQGEPMSVDLKNPYLKRFVKTAKVQGIRLKTQKCHGASDARFFSDQGSAIIISKPVCSEPHIDYEWVDLSSLFQYYHLLKSFLSVS